MRKQGFTLIELMIVVAVVGIIATTVIAGISGGCNDRGSVEQEARAWAQGLGIEVKAVSCVGADNDGDGYVSCTIMPVTGEPMPVECVGAWGWGEGCRAPKASLRVHVQGE